jgi:hypothetical protein
MNSLSSLLQSPLLWLAPVLLFSAPVAAGDLAVGIDFPGGSAAVESIDQEKRLIRLSPTAHKDRGWVCWWYFRLSGATPGETVTLDVGDAPWATPDRAAFSDDGKTWRQTGPGKRQGQRIVYQQKIKGDTGYFAWGPPFVPADAERLVKEAAEKSPHAEAFTLCTTRENRLTPALRIAEPGTPEDERYGIWVHARQHAWESGSSWIAKGFVDWLLSDDAAAKALRRRTTITIVPVMDIDNVHRGAGGKNQVPQDHNRDWTDQPHWRSVAAAQEAIREMDAEGRFDVFLDLHNPGANARNPYFYVPPDELLSETGKRNLQTFLAAAKAEITGPLSFIGETIPSGSKYDPKNWRAISKNWVAAHCREHVVAVTLETAWNTPHSTTAGYEQVGRELGKAVERYLRQDVRR